MCTNTRLMGAKSPTSTTMVQGATVRLRPRSLVAAARLCSVAMLRQGKGPRAEEATRLAEAESSCEAQRETRRGNYSSRRHVEALAALMIAESRAAQAVAASVLVR